MPTIQIPPKSRCGAPMKLLPTSTVAAVTKAMAAIRNIPWWKSTGIRSFWAMQRQIQRALRRLPATQLPAGHGDAQNADGAQPDLGSLERPDAMGLRDAVGLGAPRHQRALAADGPQITGGPEDCHADGHRHRGTERGLAQLVDRDGESVVLIAPPKAEA